jgi:hypothetical protein
LEIKSQPLDPRFRDSIFSKETKEEKGGSFFTSHLREHEEKRERRNFKEREKLQQRRGLEFQGGGSHSTRHENQGEEAAQNRGEAISRRQTQNSRDNSTQKSRVLGTNFKEEAQISRRKKLSLAQNSRHKFQGQSATGSTKIRGGFQLLSGTKIEAGTISLLHRNRGRFAQIWSKCIIS